MPQTLCADIHFITGGACTCSVCSLCAGQLLEKHTRMQVGLYMCPSISADRNYVDEPAGYHKCCSMQMAKLKEKDSMLCTLSSVEN